MISNPGKLLKYEVESCDDKVNTWFSEAIGRHCTFMRCSSSKNHSCTLTGKNGHLCGDSRSKLSFINEGQLLLISEESVSDLNSRLSLDPQVFNSQTTLFNISANITPGYPTVTTIRCGFTFPEENLSKSLQLINYPLWLLDTRHEECR